MAMQVVFVAFAAFVVAAGEKNHCCSPRKWEAYQRMFYDSSAVNYAKQETDVIKLSYDADRQLVAASTQVTIHNVRSYYRILMDYTKEKSFQVFNGSCLINKLKLKFRERCVQDEATYVGSLKVGFGSNSVSADNYQIHIPKQLGLYRYIITVSPVVSEKNDQLCVPVSETYFGFKFGQHGPEKFLQNVRYSNITAGIEDEHVFDIPKECDTKKEMNFRMMYRVGNNRPFNINLENESYFGI